MTNNNKLPKGHESLMTLNGKHFTATKDGITFTGKVIANPYYREVYLDNDTFDIGTTYSKIKQEYDHIIFLCEGNEWAFEHREISDFRITD